MTLEELNIKITANAEQAKQELKSVQPQVNSMTKGMQKNGKAIQVFTSLLTGNVAGAAHGVKTLGNNFALISGALTVAVMSIRAYVQQQQQLLASATKLYSVLGTNAKAAREFADSMIKATNGSAVASSELAKFFELTKSSFSNQQDINANAQLAKDLILIYGSAEAASKAFAEYSSKSAEEQARLRESIRQTASEFEGLGTNSLAALKNSFQTILAGIGSILVPILQPIIKTITTIFSAIQPLLNALSKIAELLDFGNGLQFLPLQITIEAITKGVEFLYKILAPIFEAIKKAIAPLFATLSQLMDAFSELGDAIMSLFGNDDTIVKFVSEFVSNCVKPIVTGLTYIIALIKVFAEALRGISGNKSNNGIKDTTDDLGDLSDAAEQTKQSLSGLDEVTVLGDSASASVNLPEDIADVANINKELQDAIKNVKGLLSNLSGFFKPMIDFCNGFVDALKSIVDVLQNSFGSLFESLKESFANIYSFVQDIWVNIVSAFGNVGNNLSSAWQGLANSLSTIYSSLQEVGNYLTSGFKQAWDLIGDTITTIANSFINFINIIINGLNAVINGLNNIPFVDIPTISNIPNLDGSVQQTQVQSQSFAPQSNTLSQDSAINITLEVDGTKLAQIVTDAQNNNVGYNNEVRFGGGY